MDFEMEALLTQGNSEKFKIRFNVAFLAGSDYSSLPSINRLFVMIKAIGSSLFIIKFISQQEQAPALRDI
ncbi:MAG: hypothetical protein ACI4IR_04910 [Eubacterium sp.]